MSTYAVATRLVGADLNFIESVMDRGFTRAEALHIFRVYKKLRAIRLDGVGGRWSVKHGALWDADVLRRALEQPAPAQRR